MTSRLQAIALLGRPAINARRLPSTARESQPECNHLIAVAHEQAVADQHRVVPGLALDRREPGKLGEIVGDRSNQRQLTPNGQNTRNS